MIKRKKLSPAHHKILYKNCLNSDIKDAQNLKADPFLCCISNGLLMGTANNDVLNGDANGTTWQFQKCILKTGKTPHKITIDGYWVYSVNVDEVEYILL